MNSSDDEEQLRGRVERSVADMPGPDPASLAGIRARLDTQRPGGRRNLWFAAALAAALGSTAAAALWSQSGREAEHTTDEQAGQDPGKVPEAEQIDGGITEEPIETAPVEPDDQGENASEPVIFREQ